MYQYYENQSIETLSKIEKNKSELKKPQYSRFFSTQKQKLMSFAEYIADMEKQKNELIFSIAEATQGMNMKKIEQWTVSDIENFLEYKKQQYKYMKIKKI